MPLLKTITVIAFFATLQFTAFSQKNNYLIPEVMIGSIVPNYMNGPQFGPRIGAAITYYKSSNEDTPTNQYYKFPLIGIQAGFHRLGNPFVYGNELNVMPVLGLNLKKGMFQWGIGTSYFTKTHQQNELNKSIGSHFNWAFQWMYYRNFKLTDHNNIRLGFGYHHSSNGHTQLPNYGLNSAVLSVALTPSTFNIAKSNSKEIPKSREVFIVARSGIGFHELGSTTSPVGGDKKLVFSSSFGVGITFKQHFRWYAGFGTRHYQHYADSIANSPILQELEIHPNNHFFMMGIEYLIYHVGISIEGGINLSKPFYYHFAEEYENTESIKYTLKKIFPSRMGIKLYLLNTAKKPKHNLYISAHINANFGQADFSEASLGYVYNFQ
ncbi:acyloxyacyl hydrolase [Marivirga sp.]|uniref:acyloxyacyl hydrolase n=1 Tax=Marivirga sp. TaxID=2018662 RepID=UPI002D80A358|nr:acyloxyacyl hydrolase [Marivirga sp.]HET8859130.1 acyloxyacyl hydrolase [Marivirga sp.]